MVEAGLTGLVLLTVSGSCSRPPMEPHRGKAGSQPASAIYRRPEPQPWKFEPPPGVRSCRFSVEETTTERQAETPRAQVIIELDYAMLVPEGAPAELRVLRIRARGRKKNYKVDVDSARPGDTRRIVGGADTIDMPKIAAAFALLNQRLEVDLSASPPQLSQGGNAVRSAYLQMFPPGPRNDPAYQRRAELRLSDENILTWLLPQAAFSLRLSEGTQKGEEAQLTQEGLQAKGPRGYRVAVDGDRYLIEVKEAFTPNGPVPDLPPLSGMTVSRLAGLRERTLSLQGSDPCFVQAAESLNTRFNLRRKEDRSDGEAIERSQVRIWSRGLPSQPGTKREP